MGNDTDSDGWKYGWNVTEKNWSATQSLHHVVRIRVWRRECVYDPVAFLSGTDGMAEPQLRARSPNEPIYRTYEIFENERWVVFKGTS